MSHHLFSAFTPPIFLFSKRNSFPSFSVEFKYLKTIRPSSMETDTRNQPICFPSWRSIRQRTRCPSKLYAIMRYEIFGNISFYMFCFRTVDVTAVLSHFLIRSQSYHVHRSLLVFYIASFFSTIHLLFSANAAHISPPQVTKREI
jgi:hypothetical protein